MKRPSIFVSYAHRDSMEFTRRLVFSLSMYMDVFWDRRLQSGPYPQQLYSEIEKNDYFLFVISPSSLESEWCLKELRYAEDVKSDKILLALPFGDCHSNQQNELQEKYTFGTFVDDFDAGFRHITQMTLSQPVSSWEGFHHQHDDDAILAYVGLGYLPGVIIKEFTEWVLLSRLWEIVEERIEELQAKGNWIVFSKPSTLIGMYRELEPIMIQFDEVLDAFGWNLIFDIKPIIEEYIYKVEIINDNDHLSIGRISGEILIQIRDLLIEYATLKVDAKKLHVVTTRHNFIIADKLRSLIKLYSRRSRYLY